MSEGSKILVTPYLYCGDAGIPGTGCGELVEVLHTAEFTDRDEAQFAMTLLRLDIAAHNEREAAQYGEDALPPMTVEFEIVEQ